jgi:polysaccharide biosynthesis transport protein
MQLIRQAMDRARNPEAAPGPGMPSPSAPTDRFEPLVGLEQGALQPEFPAAPPVVPGLATPVRLPLDREQAQRARIVLPDDDTPAAHALRMLRARLRRPLGDGRIRNIGIVSPQSGAGTSLTAANLALCFAADPEHAVTLVELNLRAPSLRHLFGVAPERGFDDYLSGACSLEEAAFALTEVERLQVLAVRAAGSVVPGLAVTGRLQALFDGFRRAPTGQLLFVDLPPALASDDVLTVARGLDALIVVGYAGRTRRDELGTTLRLLQEVPVLCGVLNGASGSARGLL